MKEIIDFEQFRDILEPVFENIYKKDKSLHSNDKPRLHYVPTGANQETQTQSSYSIIGRMPTNYYLPLQNHGK